MARKKNVLVVDDEPAVRFGMDRMLSARGYSVTVAQGFDVAVEVLRTGPFDVLLCDFDLKSARDGIDLVEHARTHHPGMVRIMITGDPGEPRVRHALRDRTVTHVFSKPLDMALLTRAMGSATLPDRAADPDAVGSTGEAAPPDAVDSSRGPTRGPES